MKKIIITTVALALTLTLSNASAERQNNRIYAKYYPVTEFMKPDSTLGKWFRQYIDTTSGKREFSDFLKRLSESEVLWQRSRKAGLSYGQLYSPIITLLTKDLTDMRGMTDQEMATIRLSMLELDIALSAIDSTIPPTAHEEFRREVLRGAKPLTQVAKLPISAVEAMSFTIMTHKVSERLNKTIPSPKPRKYTPESINPQPFNPPTLTNPELENWYGRW